MARRRAWNGRTPGSEAEARRYLLDVTQQCIERSGPGRASLSDVAAAAGVTRQTVYRYFTDAEDLFQTAAVLASGGFLERMRARVRKRQGLSSRTVEWLVRTVREIPGDAHLSALVRSENAFNVSSALELGFVQEELAALAEAEPGLGKTDLDELAELLVRLLRSFLDDPGPRRSEAQLRTYLSRWLVPAIEERIRSKPASGRSRRSTNGVTRPRRR